MKTPLFRGIHNILFKTAVLEALCDFLLESLQAEFSIFMESLNYHEDWFLTIKVTDILFMNHYLQKDVTFCIYIVVINEIHWIDFFI